MHEQHVQYCEYDVLVLKRIAASLTTATSGRLGNLMEKIDM